MEGHLSSGRMAKGTPTDQKLMQKLQKDFVEVQGTLDQNRLLINEISKNQESASSADWNRNVGLIRKLNSNVQVVHKLYANISSNLARSKGSSSKGEASRAPKSNGKHGKKTTESG
ncbi:hypothetical protein Ancab_012595 [Ancistrocladus abbreviatus]